MSKRRYTKKEVIVEPEEVSLTEFNRSLLHLIKTPKPKDQEIKERVKKEK
jgi:hypothetical protein